MIASGSAVPWIVLAMLLMAVLSAVQIRRLLPAVGRSQAVRLSDIDALATIKCGFQIRKPGMLAFNYPLGTLILVERKIVLRGPLGDYEFERSEVAVEWLRRAILFRRFQLSSDELIVRVFVRDVSELRGTWLVNALLQT